MFFKPKKNLGQNFLIDQNIIKKISNLGNIGTNDTIIEIGPGTGNLTNFIISHKPKKIILIEKDKRFCGILKNKFNKLVKLLNDDFIELDKKLIDYKNLIIFGNLPYNVSTQILIKIIKNINLRNCKKLILMFQKEVADRIIADSNIKSYSRISVISQLKFHIEKVLDVNPKSFSPIPKVYSSVLIFKPKNQFPNINKIENLEYITNIFFNHRRKMIRKPLKILFKNPNHIASKLKLNLNVRPQNLDVDVYYKLCLEYEKLVN